MDVSYNGCDLDEYLQKLNNLIKAVETTLKDCNRKYKNKLEIDSLFASLNVKFKKSNHSKFNFKANLEIYKQRKFERFQDYR